MKEDEFHQKQAGGVAQGEVEQTGEGQSAHEAGCSQQTKFLGRGEVAVGGVDGECQKDEQVGSESQCHEARDAGEGFQGDAQREVQADPTGCEDCQDEGSQVEPELEEAEICTARKHK